MPQVKDSIKPKQVKRLFHLTSELADLTEEILEEKAQYSLSFLTGLKHSIKEASQGKVKKINSLADLR